MPTKRELRAGIIGCGGIAESKYIPALARIKEVEVTAFCNRTASRAEKCAKAYGNTGAKIYTDYRKLLESNSLDIVYVLTPNATHAEITVNALEAGKHVLCEKPMATNYADALRMLEASKRTGKKLTVGYQSRFRPEIRYLKELCADGGLGGIYFAKAHAIRRRGVPTWGVFLDEEQQGGGPLIDIGTHSLDLAMWLMDNFKPKTVTGSVYKKLGAEGNCGNEFGPWDPDKFNVEDSAFGYITMENGASIFLESSWALNTLDVSEARVTLFGDKAGADMKDGLRINGAELGRLYTKKLEFGPETDTPEYLEQRAWIDAILNDGDAVVKPEQAAVVTQILGAVYQSAKTGTQVIL